MNGHELHGPSVPGLGKRLLLVPRVAKRIHVLHRLAEPVSPARNEVLGDEKKLPEVEPPRRTVGKPRDGGGIPQSVHREVDRPKSVSARVFLSFFPQEPQVFLYSPDLFPLVRPEMGEKLVVRRPEVRGPEHARLGQGVVGVEKAAEHGENVPHLGDGVEVAAYAGLEPHSRPREGLFVDRNVARPSKQQGDFARGALPRFPHLRRNCRGLLLHGVAGSFPEAAYDLHRGLPARLLSRGMFHVLVVARLERAVEKGVEKPYQGSARPVVGREGYPFEIVPPQYAREKLGLRSPKAVDRLVHVPDQHQASALVAVGEKVHELELKGIGVLELVDYDELEESPVMVQDPGVFPKQVDRRADHVLVLDSLPGHLGFHEKTVRLPRETEVQGVYLRIVALHYGKDGVSKREP